MSFFSYHVVAGAVIALRRRVYKWFILRRKSQFVGCSNLFSPFFIPLALFRDVKNLRENFFSFLKCFPTTIPSIIKHNKRGEKSEKKLS